MWFLTYSLILNNCIKKCVIIFKFVKKKIYLHLSGGLGNQLFQYAAAKNLAIINDADLLIDSLSGFVTDFKDFRKFSLNKKKLKTNINGDIGIFY